jgi:nucleotide-binding universal stress UspA family protein
MSVVVAYGATEESEAALTHGVAEAVRRQAPLHVLVTSAEAETAAQHRLHSTEEKLSVWALHEAPAHQSPAHAVLDVAAEVNAEVIVVGTRRRSPVGKLLLGSLAQEILLAAETPVLLVKP